MRNDRGKAHVGVLVLVVLVATIAAVGLSFWMSVNRIGELSTQLGNQYKEYEQRVEEFDYGSAVGKLREMIQTIGAIDEQTDSWSWTVMGYVPVVGVDVNTARDTADIAQDLASRALLPVLGDAESIVADEGTNDLGTVLSNKLDAAKVMVGDLQSAREIVADCKQRADALPASRIEQVNKAVEKVREATSTANETLDAIAPALDGIDALLGE
ncbi:MAG: hypothetical protein IKG22_08485 [Atopobiaceae bacterium]|nr:hypothetical protein [Atopobiaceae bacterium]